MSWKRDEDRIILDLTIDQYHALLINLGYALGAASNRGEDPAPHLRLINSINEGNPNWVPYIIPEPIKKGSE